MSVNLAGPAYRVTVPACVLVTALRKKLKAEQEARLKAEQEANEKKMWYLVIIFCILVGLAVLAVFFIKGKHHSSNDPSNGQTKRC
ncbi:flagellar biosynthesis protein FlgG [Helicobacter pylori]|uniref:flagellar biosynthesis protein FlgG n=1 Tax=Helicobacter pylori TaxID=210 RepID=UPI001E408FC6|nr:flagellar biosynthesis protein FlgG [Helicobacter pylori]